MRTLFVDCRYELGRPGRGRELYLDGHVPGAAFLDLDTDLSDLSVPGAGRHPLPDAERFAAAAGGVGIGPGVLIAAYGNGAPRLWWLLRHFGHEAVGVIDAWHGEWRGGEEELEPAVFEPRERAGDTISADELLARLGEPGLVVVDARAPERYCGEIEPIDRVAGRIPGAVNAPIDAPLPEEVLAAPELVVYCGSGVAACNDLLKLYEAGRPDARLYAGSWSDWSTRGLPVERG